MRKLKLVFCVCLMTTVCLPQTQQPVAGYDIRKTRLLIQTAGTFVFTANQGLIDLDSAMILVCKAEHTKYSMSYNEDYETGKTLPGEVFIEAGNLPAAGALLQTLQGESRVLLLLQLGGYYLHRAGTQAGDLDKAFDDLQQAEKESLHLQNLKLLNAALNLLGNYAAQAGNTEMSREYFSNALDVCRKMNNRLSFANTLNNQAISLSYYDSSRGVLLKQALSIYQQLNEKEKQVKALGELAGVCFVHNNMDSTILLTKQAISLQNAIGFRHTSYSYDVLSYINLTRANYAEALQNATASVSVLQANGDTALAPYSYVLLAQAYNMLQQPDEAVSIFYKVLDSHSMEPLLWYQLLINAANALVNENKPEQSLQLLQRITKNHPPPTQSYKMKTAVIMATAYDHLPQYREAEKYWIQAAEAADSLHQPEMYRELANTYTGIAEFYANQKQFSKAAYYLDKAGPFINGEAPIYTRCKLAWVTYKIDSANGKYLLAINDFRTYKYYSDSFESSQALREANKLAIKYETEKKERNIQLLNEQAKLRQAELAKTTLFRNTTLAGIIVLLFIVTLVYHQYRVNKKTSKKINDKNEMLAHLLTEKEWLLKEIHHRVKNNLQMVVSLLELQPDIIGNEPAAAAIRESRNRIYSMCLLHQKLYQSDDIIAVNMRSYLIELIHHLRDAYDSRHRVYIHYQVESVILGISQAVSVGLIVNEALTNSFKYAFRDENGSPEITVLLEQPEKEKLVLMVADNGAGLAAHSEPKKGNSLGFKLMNGLAEDLDGEISIESSGGTRVCVSFTANELLYPEPETTTQNARL